ncbi:MAG: metallophosphoesterase, partial [Paludibacter sp.]
IAAFRDMNNAAPTVCFGFESMPGHQKDPGRGGYSGTAVGGGTFGGCGFFSAPIGGLWDALLSEGRNFWLFANSDSHNEVGDFYPGEYQKNYTYTAGKSAQNIVDGLRSGNTWVVEGDLIDSLIYKVETIGTEKVTGVMGSSMVINKGKSVKITIKARDPQGNNFNTYSPYTNPELNHIDIIKGKVTGKIDPASPNYNVQTVTTTSVIARFDGVGGVTDTKSITSQKWTSLGNGWVEMSMIVPNVTDSVYFRLRGSNLGLNVTNETDADGNPLADALMGANDATKAFADLWFYSNPIFVYTTPVKTAKFQIKQGSDDLEERIAAESGQTQTNTVGSVDWTSSDLELGCEGSANASPQLIGLRFAGINLPKNFVISNAYIETEVDEATMVDPSNLVIWSENNDNPATFTNTANCLTSRPKSSESVNWTVPTGTGNVVDQKFNSISITSLVQANLNRTGWAAGNAMAFYIKGSGRRVVESYEGEASAAAALVIEYVMSEQDIKDMQAADETAYLASLPEINMIYTSDSHYGITRTSFQGAATVNAQVVNAAMVAKMNEMSTVVLPNDNGIKANQPIGAIDFVINTGDISNRQESASSIQSAATSWNQFSADYISGLTLKNSLGQNAKLLLSPGNHDVSNAIGYTKTLNPAIDKTTMVNMYNMMLNPSVPKTTADYDYTTDKINYSKNIGGVHFMFVTLWPDSANRVWMANDMASISATMPVVIFTHDQPAIETKHLRNPNGSHTINGTDKFENMVEEVCKDGLAVTAPSTIEQRGFASFVKSHPNIKAYFHGNSNWNQFYTYTGPDNDIALRTIRIDSPMKGEGEVGNNSTTDDKKLSYQVISLDPVSKNMTVRQCLWNPTATAGAPVQWGESITFALSVADSLAAVANSLTETNYSIPSWTLLKRAVIAAVAAKDSASTAQLQLALNGLKANDTPYSISTTFNGSPTSQLGFAWYTNAGVTDGKVEIVAGNSTDFTTPLYSITATATPLNNVNYNVSNNNLTALAGIASNSKRSYVSNKALATGLTPNTTYSFRVGKTGAWSEVGSFTTAKDTKEPFSFVYTTDPQANAVEMFDISQKTTHAAHSMYPNANFWLSCGDLIETSGSTNSEWEYEQFFATQQDIFMKKPLAAVIGNHDQSSNKNFTNHFNTAGPAFDATSTTPGSIYSYVYGDALFMALNYEDYGVAGRLTDIANWMRAQVAANPNVKWRIVHYHKTIYTGSSSHQSDTDGKTVRDALAPVFDELHIDLALQGHDHVYEVMGPINAKALVTNAVKNQIDVTFDARTNVTAKQGGIFNTLNGTLYFLNNSAGRKKYEPRSQSQMAAVETGLGLSNYFGMFSGRFGQTGNPTFSNITVSTDTIDVKTYEVSDLGVASPFDSFKVVKSTDFTTGVKNVGANGQDAISVYPIPVKDYAYITFKNNVKAKVDVYSINGTLVKSESINGSTQINLSKLSKGNYIMKVSAGNDNYSVKFIKE